MIQYCPLFLPHSRFKVFESVFKVTDHPKPIIVNLEDGGDGSPFLKTCFLTLDPHPIERGSAWECVLTISLFSVSDVCLCIWRFSPGANLNLSHLRIRVIVVGVAVVASMQDEQK